jgi:molybdopterin/thiamine biosynthesis adenylyltransferase
VEVSYVNEFVIPATVVNEVREAVLREDGNEWFTYLYCGRSDGRLLATDHLPVEAEDHLTQERGGCRVDPQVEVDHLSECVSTFGRVPCLGHSHPFSHAESVGFSGLDEDMMRDTTEWLASAFPDEGIDPVFIVVGQYALRAGRYDRETDTIEHLPVRVLGRWALERPLALPDSIRSKGAETIDIADERHDRTMRALTEVGTERLAGSRVGVISAGGLGSIFVEQLSRLGVGELVVVDPDVVEESNLNRLQGAFDGDVGKAKVDVMRRHVERIDPSIEIEVFQERAQDAAPALKSCDALIAGVDRMSARMWVNEFAVRHLIPYVDAGSLITTTDDGESVTDMEGYIQTIVPGVTGCFDCLDRGDPEQARIEQLTDEELEAEIADGYVDESTLTPEPAVIHLNGLVASKAVDALVKLLTGFDKPTPFIRYEGLNNELTAVQTRPSPECFTCSKDGILGDGDVEWDLERVAKMSSDTIAPKAVPEASENVEPVDVFGDGNGDETTPVGSTSTPWTTPGATETQETIDEPATEKSADSTDEDVIERSIGTADEKGNTSISSSENDPRTKESERGVAVGITTNVADQDSWQSVKTNAQPIVRMFTTTVRMGVHVVRQGLDALLWPDQSTTAEERTSSRWTVDETGKSMEKDSLGDPTGEKQDGNGESDQGRTTPTDEEP